MKNQNDMIVSIVAGVIGLGVFLTLFFTKREPTKPADPAPVNLSAPKAAEGTVTYAGSLPGGGSTSGNAGGGAQGPSPAAAAGGGGGGQRPQKLMPGM